MSQSLLATSSTALAVLLVIFVNVEKVNSQADQFTSGTILMPWGGGLGGTYSMSSMSPGYDSSYYYRNNYNRYGNYNYNYNRNYDYYGGYGRYGGYGNGYNGGYGSGYNGGYGNGYGRGYGNGYGYYG